MTPEQKQRIEQIEQWQESRRGLVDSARKHADLDASHPEIRMHGYIDFLLSLVKSQEAGAGIPQWRKGWPEVDGFYWSRETPNDMNILLVEIHRNRLTICGGNKLNVKEAFEGDDDEFLGPITPTATADAATSMRSACVLTIKKLRDQWLKREGIHLDSHGECASAAALAEHVSAANKIIRELESLSIEKPKE